MRTDGSAAYRSLSGLGYEHQRMVMLGSDVPAHVSMAGVHRVASLIKRWILGTHHGSVQPGHLDAYLAANSSLSALNPPHSSELSAATPARPSPGCERR